MSADKLVLRMDLVDTLFALIIDHGDGIIDPGHAAEGLKVSIHLLIGRGREHPIPRESVLPVLLQYGLSMAVKVNCNRVFGLYRGEYEGIILNV